MERLFADVILYRVTTPQLLQNGTQKGTKEPPMTMCHARRMWLGGFQPSVAAGNNPLCQEHLVRSQMSLAHRKQENRASQSGAVNICLSLASAECDFPYFISQAGHLAFLHTDIIMQHMHTELSKTCQTRPSLLQTIEVSRTPC